MDSKLRRTAILSCLAVMVLVVASVLLSNRKTETDSRGGMTASNTRESEEAPATVPEESNLKAFEKEDSFFDPDYNALLDGAKDLANRLSLIVTSVEKDLRIQVVDNEGSPVSGESFFVELSDEKEENVSRYKDLDKDGIIYIEDCL